MFYRDTIIDDSGYRRPVSGVTVYLFNPDGSIPGAVAENPTLSDGFGNFEFDAPEGLYRVEGRLAGVSIFERNIVVGTPPEFKGDPGPPGGNVMSIPTFASIATIPAATLVGVSRLATASWGTPGQYRPDGWGRATYTRFTAPLAALPAAGQGVWWSYDGSGAQAWYIANEADDVFLDQLGAVFAPREAAIDTRPAWDAFQVYALWKSQFRGFGFNPGGATLRLRPGYYRLGPGATGTNWLDLKVCQRILGPGNGFAGGEPCIVEADAGMAGFIVQRYNTIGFGVEATPTTGADGTEIAGFRLTCRGKVSGVSADGILGRARAYVHDMRIDRFSRHGVFWYASAGAGGEAEGNANNWVMHNVRCDTNGSQSVGGSGVCAVGADSNAGNAWSLDVTSNYRWGIEDHSFLGNKWHGHADANGLRSSAGRDLVVASVYHKPVGYEHGFFWAVRDGQDANASSAEPGSNPNIWFAWSNPIDAPDYFNPQWVSGNQYQAGGAIVHSGLNAPSTFDFYTEGGQPPVQSYGLAQFDGNIIASGQSPETNSSTGGQNRSFSRPVRSAKRDVVTGVTEEFFLGDYLNAGLAGGGRHSVYSPNGWHFGHNFGSAPSPDWAFGFANAAYPYLITGPTTTRTFGRSTPQPYYLAPRLFAFGGENGRVWAPGAAPPGDGNHARGEIVWNPTPSAGGFIGWTCVAAGTPGTWKGFGQIEA